MPRGFSEESTDYHWRYLSRLPSFENTAQHPSQLHGIARRKANQTEDGVKIAAVTISDRATSGEYEDKSGPAILDYMKAALTVPWEPVARVIPDGIESVRDCLTELCDEVGVDLILTTGGTGPAPRDLTPEAMALVMERELAGFGELMRRVSLEEVPTAILSRQTAGIRGKSLIINLPGKPSAIKTCLDAVFPAVPYCLDLIGAGRIETSPDVIDVFRPKAK